MPLTPRKHFDEDIERAEALVAHAKVQPSVQSRKRRLRDDLLRSAWMFAIGALDAYFCDAYISVLARTLRAKSMQSDVNLPTSIESIELPIGSVFAEYQERANWRWRMAARSLMEKDNVLSLETIRSLLNPFFAETGNRKFFTQLLDSWAALPAANARLFGMSATDYLSTTGTQRDQARKDAWKQMQKRFRALFQRRHDCIHNCDRPKVSPQTIESPGTVANVIRDVRFLVENCDDHIDSEFRQFVDRIGCNAKTRNALGV